MKRNKIDVIKVKLLDPDVLELLEMKITVISNNSIQIETSEDKNVCICIQCVQTQEGKQEIIVTPGDIIQRILQKEIVQYLRCG